MQNKMNFKYFMYFLLVIAGMVTSCADMLDTSSDNVAYEKAHQLNNANDSIYSVVGVLAKIQKLADRIVIYGELRGDLMTFDKQHASIDLQDIGQFRSTLSNTYAGKRDFYDVINNCNYIIAHMDTSLTEGQTKVMLPEFAQVKTLRAWTYLQMALIFGQVNYFTRPLTIMGDAGNIGTPMSIDNLVSTLIKDIEPYADTRLLNYGSVDSWNSVEFFIPTRMLLGDLYLYANNYTKAAENYYTYIYHRGLTVSSGYANTWKSTRRDDVNGYHFNAYRNEVITRIVFDKQLKSYHSQLGKLTYSETPGLLPTSDFVTVMNGRTHFHTDNNAGISRYFNGDLRGMGFYGNGKTFSDAFGPISLTANGSKQTLITKFYNNLNASTADALQNRTMTSLAIYRPSMVYLRYAEAINRLGKSSMAFAILKYGLKRLVVNDTLKINPDEIKSLPYYMDFTDSRFDNNVGTAARGCGMGISFDNNRYVIPANVDTIDFVEEAILQEMAAETCFEGNRFFDLLCVSHHRSDFPRFMAEKVAAKYDDETGMLAKLLKFENWFVGK